MDPQGEIDRLRSKVGWAKIEIDETVSTIRKLDPAIYCDLSAIAKGYAVDCVSGTLSGAHFVEHMVEIGGEVRTSGRNAAGQPWRIAIERPAAGERGIQRVLPFENLAMATSGDYRNSYELDGRQLSHTIDPRTGHPVQHPLASVSVVDNLCMRADGYATALMVLGESEGYRLAVEKKLAAFFVVRGKKGSFAERATPAFQSLFGSHADAESDAERSSARRN